MLRDADHDWAVIEHMAERDTPPDQLSMIRGRAAAILQLGPSQPTSSEPAMRALADFVDQFLVDVSGISGEQRAAVAGALGHDLFAFAQAVYVVDLSLRRREIRRRLGLADSPTRPQLEVAADIGLWPAIESYQRSVARLRSLDPATTEIVRARGAAAHRCRLCASRLSLSAVEQLGSSAPLEAILTSTDIDLAPEHLAALELVDAMVTQPSSLAPATLAELHTHYTDEQLSEMVHDVARNALNKLAVALGGDAPTVTEGFEYFDIDDDGELVADVDPDKVRSALAP